jgi:23S rRNA pseudouridine1911/1915/1917 synthase
MSQQPAILAEDPAYLVVYKPPNIHSAPLREGEPGTLLDWAASRFPEVLRVKGKKPFEGGLLHRLDFETGGLLLIARNQTALDNLLSQQLGGSFVKEYEAFSAGPGTVAAGFPAYPADSGPAGSAGAAGAVADAAVIESCFRPYGVGRKQVRPVIGSGGTLYRTELRPAEESGAFSDYVRAFPGGRLFSVILRRGFRHQIRCHLAWIGWPLLNDTLYGGGNTGGFLALRANALSFKDPVTGKALTVRLPRDFP